MDYNFISLVKLLNEIKKALFIAVPELWHCPEHYIQGSGSPQGAVLSSRYLVMSGDIFDSPSRVVRWVLGGWGSGVSARGGCF